MREILIGRCVLKRGSEQYLGCAGHLEVLLLLQGQVESVFAL